MNPVKHGIDGDFSIEIRRSDGSVRLSLDGTNKFLLSGYRDILKNLVKESDTISGQDRLNLFLGSGTTEPTIYDTGLEARSSTLDGKRPSGISGLSSALGESRGSNMHVVSAYELEYQYDEGEAEGVWSEIGLGHANYATAMTRALIRDEEGAPITLQVLSDEYLFVRYRIYFVTPVSVDLGSFIVDGNSASAIYMNNVANRTTSSNIPAYWGFADARTVVDNQSDYRNSVAYSPALVVSENEVNYDQNAGTYSISNLRSFQVTPDFVFASTRESGLVADIQVQIDPAPEDINIYAIGFESRRRMLSNGYSYYRGEFSAIFFDPVFIKPADHRTIFTLTLDMRPDGYDPELDPEAT